MRDLIAVAFWVYSLLIPLLVMMLDYFKMSTRREQVTTILFALYAVVCCVLFVFGRHSISEDVVWNGVLLSSFLTAYMQVAFLACTPKSEEQGRLAIRRIMSIVTIAVLAIVAILTLYDFLLNRCFL